MSEQDDITIQNAIGYSFKGMVKFQIIEELVKELNLECNKYWMRPSTDEDWFVKGDWVILREEPNPILLDEYELQYDLPYDDTTASITKFAEFLIDSYLEYIGYLEGCLKQEIDNKKEDTE